MIIRIFPLENELKFSDDKIPIISISNRFYYSKIIMNINNLCESIEIEEKIIIESEGSLLDFKKDVLLTMNFFDFDFNQKKILNALNQYIEDSFSIETEKQQVFMDSIKNISDICTDILNEIPFDTEMKERITIVDYLKMAGLKVQNPICNRIADRIFNLIDILAFSKIFKVCIFVNLKLFVSEEELIEIYKYSLYNKVNILLIEFGEPNAATLYEEILWIDADYVETKIN